MKKILVHIAKFLKKRGPILVLLLVLAFVLKDIDLAHAADPNPNDVKATTEQSLAFMISIFLKALNTFLWPFLVVIGELMDNDLIIGPGMEDRLLSIWVQVRNLVNIGFVLFLLVIAIYNVLPLSESEGNLALKTALPKLILGIVLVNFTFLGGKVVLDIANVGTTAVFALPELVDDYNFDKQREEFAEIVCLKVDRKTASEEESGATTVTASVYNKGDTNPEPPIFTKLFCEVAEAAGTGKTADEQTYSYEAGDYTGKLNETMQATYFTDLNENNVGLIMAVNMGALDSLVLLKKDAITDFGDLVVNSLFSLVMYAIFAMSYLVLGLVLLARIVVLWVALALSPIIVLFYVIPQLKDAAGGNLDVVEKASKHLLAPIIIGLTLTIGFLMISAIGDFANIGNIKADELLSAKYLLTGIEDMETFIIAIATVVIIWTGIFAAASGTYAEFATNAVKGFGEKIGGALAKAPLYATTIPIGIPGENEEQQRVSPMAILGIADAAMNNLQGRDRVTNDLDKLRKASPLLSKLIGNTDQAKYRSTEQLRKNVGRYAGESTISQTEFRDLWSSLAETTRRNPSLDPADRDRLVSEIRTVGEANNPVALAFLLDAYSAEKFGMKGEEKVFKNLQTKLNQIGYVAAAPAQAPAQADTTPKKVELVPSTELKQGLDSITTTDKNLIKAATEAVAAVEAQPGDKKLYAEAVAALAAAGSPQFQAQQPPAGGGA